MQALRVGVLASVRFCLLIDKDGLARRQVSFQLEAQSVQSNAFRSHHSLHPRPGIAAAQHDRANAVRIPKCHDADANNHGNDGVTA